MARRFRFKTVRRHATAVLARAAVWIISHLPRRLALLTGRSIGALAHFFGRTERRRALANLEKAFGESMTERTRRTVVKGVFRNFGQSAADVLVLARHGGKRISDVIPVEDWDLAARRIEEGLSGGKGLIALSGHIGCWELMGVMFANEFPGKVLSVGRRMGFEGYDRILENVRSRLGIDITYQDESPRHVMRHLKENGVLGLLADQDFKRVQGMFVDFFGSPAFTPTGPASLCHRFGSPILPIYFIREGKGYRVEVDELIYPEGVADCEDPVRELTRQWTRSLEKRIERFPDQWVWFHDRWRTTPETLQRRLESARIAEQAQGRQD